MTEISRFWDGTVTGDASEAPYDSFTEFAKVLMSLAASGTNSINGGGVFRDEISAAGSELDILDVGVSPVTILTGRGLVYGTWYESDAGVSVAIPTPAGATRIDRIVLRKSWAAQTVRITRIAGVEGGAAPALTQVIGTTWDVPLWQVSITTGGVTTSTDQRQFIPWHGNHSLESVGIQHSFSQIGGGSYHELEIKSADEIVNNSAALQNDADFFFAIGASEKWIVEINLYVTNVTIASDFRFTFTVPAGAVGIMMGQGFGGNTTGWVSVGVPVAPGVAVVMITDANTGDLVNIKIQASIENGVTAGVVQFQWAQGTATVIDTTVKEYSQMIAHRVS